VTAAIDGSAISVLDDQAFAARWVNLATERPAGGALPSSARRA
jgi:hypothetical protein